MSRIIGMTQLTMLQIWLMIGAKSLSHCSIGIFFIVIRRYSTGVETPIVWPSAIEAAFRQ